MPLLGFRRIQMYFEIFYPENIKPMIARVRTPDSSILYKIRLPKEYGTYETKEMFAEYL